MLGWLFGAKPVATTSQEKSEEETIKHMESASPSVPAQQSVVEPAVEPAANESSSTSGSSTDNKHSSCCAKSGGACACDPDLLCTEDGDGVVRFLCRLCAKVFSTPTDFVKHRLTCIEMETERKMMVAQGIAKNDEVPDDLDKARMRMARLGSRGLNATKRAETIIATKSLYSKRQSVSSLVAVSMASEDEPGPTPVKNAMVLREATVSIDDDSAECKPKKQKNAEMPLMRSKMSDADIVSRFGVVGLVPKHNAPVVQEQSAAQENMLQKPAVDEPLIDEPMIKEPVVDEPVQSSESESVCQDANEQ